MSTRDELAEALDRALDFDANWDAYGDRVNLAVGATRNVADALIAEGWRKKPDDEALWDLADELLVGLNVYDENPPGLSEYIADRVRALMDRGQ